MRCESHICKEIKFIAIQVGRKVDACMKADGITSSQGMLLKTLQIHGASSLKDLEKWLRLSQPTVVGLAHRCEAKGLVRMFGHAEDRRVKMVELTERGQAHCREADEKFNQVEQELTSVLSSEEKESLLHLLQKISGQFKEYQEGCCPKSMMEEEETHA